MSQPAPVATLDYQSMLERRANVWLLRIGLVSGGFPMADGVGILILYFITEAETVAMFGIFWLMIGGAITFAALVVDIAYLAQAYRATVDRRRSVRMGWLLVVLGLLNIPAAIACATIGSRAAMDISVNVSLKNNGSKPIQDSRLIVDGKSVKVGTIMPGATAGFSIRLKHDSSVVLELTRDSGPFRPVKTFKLPRNYGLFMMCSIDITDDDQSKEVWVNP